MLQSPQIAPQSIKVKQMIRSEDKPLGLVIACTVIGIWASSLIFLLALDAV